jgi:hypothetical protein
MKNEWKLEITKVDNGYLCEGLSNSEDGSTMMLDEVWVVEDNENVQEYDEQETMVRLLRGVQEYFGVNPSKHNKINCRVLLEGGEDEKS